jgi:arylsulfatase A-like enzyme
LLAPGRAGSIFHVLSAAMKKRSLILITVDCLRADHVGFLGYSRPVTPFLDSLAANSLVFPEAIVAGAPTYFSFPAIIASRFPLALGRDILGIAPGEPTIATALQQAGYSTAAFLAGNPYLSARFGYHQGFDTFRDFLDSALPGELATNSAADSRSSLLNLRLQRASRRTALTAAAYDELYFWYCQWRTRQETASMDRLRRYPAADVIVDQARSWLSGLGDDPFFLWLHFMDPHHPYYPPGEALAALGESHITDGRARFLNSFWNRDLSKPRLQTYRDEIVSLYDAGIYWVDKQIARFVRSLQQFKKWDDTVFAVTADHGEEFLEHGNRYHSPTNLLEPLIRVPLLLHAPGTPAARPSQASFSLMHLAPTLLEAVGATAPDNFQGRSHWREISAGNLSDEPAIVECIGGRNNPFEIAGRMHPRLLAVRNRDYKLVFNFAEKTDSLFDLKNDSGEDSPLPPDLKTQERARLSSAALAHIQNNRRGRNLDLRLRARLRDLQQSIEPRNKTEPPTSSAI